ncbi:MAG TPA: pyridoxamine 5'-phosphate oxidase family protein [bacterium]|nr:pyridoxamine 5'-phosphate oxidase family protein [bacterium]
MAEPRSKRTTVRRAAERGRYDEETIHAILDEGIVCHVGFCVDEQPFVIPMGYGRDGNRLILHGSVGSRAMRALADGAPVCVTVTLLDGVVVARSVFHSSMNYRSVVIVGRAEAVTDPEEKMRALERLTEHLIPGRWDDARRPNDREMKGTLVLHLPLDEASAKIRTGPPKDDDEDYALPIWAGVIPFAPAAGGPEDDPKLAPGIERPEYAARYRRTATASG